MVDKLDTSLLIKLSKAEKLSWQEKAALAGTPLSILIRRAVNKVTISPKLDHTLIAQQTRQIRRIGINLNQIAKWANTYKSSAETLEIIEALQAIEQTLKNLPINKSTSFPSAPKNGGEDAT